MCSDLSCLLDGDDGVLLGDETSSLDAVLSGDLRVTVHGYLTAVLRDGRILLDDEVAFDLDECGSFYDQLGAFLDSERHSLVDVELPHYGDLGVVPDGQRVDDGDVLQLPVGLVVGDVLGDGLGVLSLGEVYLAASGDFDLGDLGAGVGLEGRGEILHVFDDLVSADIESDLFVRGQCSVQVDVALDRYSGSGKRELGS